MTASMNPNSGEAGSNLPCVPTPRLATDSIEWISHLHRGAQQATLIYVPIPELSMEEATAQAVIDPEPSIADSDDEHSTAQVDPEPSTADSDDEHSFDGEGDSSARNANHLMSQAEIDEDDINEDQASIFALGGVPREVHDIEYFQRWVGSISIDGQNPRAHFPDRHFQVYIQPIQSVGLRASIQITFKVLVDGQTSTSSEGVPKSYFSWVVIVPAMKNITEFEFQNLPQFGNSEGRSEHLPKEEAKYTGPLGSISFKCSQVIIQGNTDVPDLAYPALTTAARKYIELLSEDKGHTFHLILKRWSKHDMLGRTFQMFKNTIAAEAVYDPLQKWLPTGNLRLSTEAYLNEYERPPIKKQVPRVVFFDALDYQITLIYAATMEQEYDDKRRAAYNGTVRKVKLLHLPGSSLEDGPPSSYIAFVEDTVHEVIPLQDNDLCTFKIAGDQDGPMLWSARKVDAAMILCPRGWSAFFLKRPAKVTWDGSLDKLVEAALPSTAAKYATIADLHQVLKNADSLEISIQIKADVQNWQNEVNSCAVLCNSEELHIIELRDYLMNPDGKGKTSNFKARLEGSQYQPQDKFTPSQQQAYQDLGNVVSKIMVLSACPGSGKTYMGTKLALSFLMADPEPDTEDPNSKTRPNRVLWTSPTNEATDDGARAFIKLQKEVGLTNPKVTHLKAIRLHSLLGERKEVAKEADTKSQLSYINDEASLELAEAYKVASVARLVEKDVSAKINAGDTRRVLKDYSLSAAMLCELEKRKEYAHLRGLMSRNREDLNGVEKRQMSELIDKLLEDTLENADIIFCTTSIAAKPVVFEKFSPTLVVKDESAKETELASVSTLVNYDAHLYLLVGDDRQMKPMVNTASTTTFVTKDPPSNVFGPQLLMPLFSRLIGAGHPSSSLRENMRCCRNLYKWAATEFYQGKTVDFTTTVREDLQQDAALMRDYLESSDDCYKGKTSTNRMIIDVKGSKSVHGLGTTSSVNHGMMNVGIQELKRFLKEPALKHLHVTAICLYKGQLGLWTAALRDLELECPELDWSRVSKPRTGDSAQGYEDDYIIVDFTRTAGVGFCGNAQRLAVLTTRARLGQTLLMDVSGMQADKTDDQMLRNPMAQYLFKLIADCRKTGVVKEMHVDSSL